MILSKELPLNNEKLASMDKYICDTNISKYKCELRKRLPLFRGIDVLRNACRDIAEHELIYVDGKIDATKTFNNMDERTQLVIKILSNLPRSYFVTGATKNPEYASLTPIGLYAFKKAKNIDYESWNKKSELLPFFLGKFLYELPKIELTRQEWSAKVKESSIAAFRKVALTTIDGESKGVLSYKMNITIEKVPRNVMYMLLQTWLANVECRVPGAQILDPWNWDAVPEPIDSLPKDLAESFEDFLSEKNSSELPF